MLDPPTSYDDFTMQQYEQRDVDGIPAVLPLSTETSGPCGLTLRGTHEVTDRIWHSAPTSSLALVSCSSRETRECASYWYRMSNSSFRSFMNRSNAKPIPLETPNRRGLSRGARNNRSRLYHSAFGLFTVQFIASLFPVVFF
jgi:hypothetical protein